MRYADLCWRGIYASELGVIVTEQVSYKKPALRRETVTVPGRSGTLTIKQKPAWDSVTYTPGLAIRPGADREDVCKWLQGSGQVIFGSMPDHAYDAVIVDQFELSENSPGHDRGYYLLTPTFECQPYRYDVIPAAAMSGMDCLRGFNPKNIEAAPLITATVTPGTVLTLRMTGCSPAVIETPSSEAEQLQIILDSDAMTAYTDSGTALDGVMLGEFPLIQPGSWELTASGEAGSVLQLTLLPRWRAI